MLRDCGDVTVGNQTPRLALAGTEPRYNSVIGDFPYMTSAIMLVCGLVTRLTHRDTHRPGTRDWLASAVEGLQLSAHHFAG